MAEEGAETSPSSSAAGEKRSRMLLRAVLLMPVSITSTNHQSNFDLQEFYDTGDNPSSFLKKGIKSLARSIHVKTMILLKTVTYFTNFKV